MELSERAAIRAAVVHLDRLRDAMEDEVNRRLGRAEPGPGARAEILRRFRSFCRLSSLDPASARPSLEGLQGNASLALEEVVRHGAEFAAARAPLPQIAAQISALDRRFRAGIRRVLQPEDAQPQPRRRDRRRTPNAGRRVRGAIDRISDSYFALNLETGKLFDANPAAEALLGRDAESLLACDFWELIAPVHRQRARDLEARLDAGEDSPPVVLLFARSNGDVVPLELSVANHTIAGRRLAIFVAREAAVAAEA
jgi:PAS domain S-box-containing protein